MENRLSLLLITSHTNAQKLSLFSHAQVAVLSLLMCIMHHLVPVQTIIIIIFIFSGTAAQRELWPPRQRGFLITHDDAPQSVVLLWTSDQLVAEISTRQHTQQTNIHTPGGIRTHDRSRRAAVHLRFRPRGHWDRYQ
jgi:hypothetical protein